MDIYPDITMANIDLLNKLIAQEKYVLSKDILSPVIYGSNIKVRIAGVLLSLRVNPKNFHGWGVFHYDGNHKSVTFDSKPSLKQRREYLELLPRAQLIICSHNEKQTLGCLLNSDNRFSFDISSVVFPENISLFDTIIGRLSGEVFIYERHFTYSPRRINELKDQFHKEVNPNKVQTIVRLGIAYKYAYDELIKTRELTLEQKVKLAVEKAGGQYKGFTDRGSSLTVQLVIDGESFRPTINSKTLMLENAGICLAGGDRNFDLQSFVHVAREGQRRGAIHHW